MQVSPWGMLNRMPSCKHYETLCRLLQDALSRCSTSYLEHTGILGATQWVTPLGLGLLGAWCFPGQAMSSYSYPVFLQVPWLVSLPMCQLLAWHSLGLEHHDAVRGVF